MSGRVYRTALLRPGPLWDAIDVDLLSDGPVASKADYHHTVLLHCRLCSQCLRLSPDVDGSSVQEEEEA